MPKASTPRSGRMQSPHDYVGAGIGPEGLTRPGYARIPGLDGIRAIAALLVVVFHVFPGVGAVGYAGVDVFFVLSGFLITSLLIQENMRTGGIQYSGFVIRRFRRLIPAISVMLIGSILLALMVGGDALVALSRQVLGSLTGTYNWIEIAQHSSYFEQQSPLLFTHMWTLAVELQFYFVWPIVVIILLRFRRSWQSGVAIGIGVLSTILHALLVFGAEDVTRAYMGTDSHLWGMMMGAALAMWYPGIMSIRGGAESMPPLSERAAQIMGWLGYAGIGLVVVICLFVPDGRWFYPWGMVLVSFLALLTIRAMLPDVQVGSVPAQKLSRFLNSPMMQSLGARSYGVYLWHWPLYVLAGYAFPMVNAYLAGFIVLVLSLVFADLSYRYVETPIRKEGFWQWCKDRFADWKTLTPVWSWVTAGIAGVIAVAFIVALFISPSKSSAEQRLEEAQAEAQAQAEAAENAEKTESSATVTGEQVTVIGDSVAIAATPALQNLLPGIDVDAEVSRFPKAAPGIASTKADAGELREYVVVALGTNAVVREHDTDALLEAIGSDRKLVYVTAYGPARTTWIPEANAEMRRAAEHESRITLADWHGVVDDSPTAYLVGDSVHPTVAGAEAYAEEIVRALNSFTTEGED